MGKEIISLGFEKLIINSHAFKNPNLITKLAGHFGSQSVIGSIDVKKNFLGKEVVYSHSGSIKQKYSPVEWAKQIEELGVGELLITSIAQEGIWQGYDLDLTKRIADSVTVPVIAHGGTGNIDHIRHIVKESNVSAIGLGSMVVYQKKGMGVSVNFLDKKNLKKMDFR